MYRFDRKTGSLMLVKGSQLTPVTAEEIINNKGLQQDYPKPFSIITDEKYGKISSEYALYISSDPSRTKRAKVAAAKIFANLEKTKFIDNFFENKFAESDKKIREKEKELKTLQQQKKSQQEIGIAAAELTDLKDEFQKLTIIRVGEASKVILAIQSAIIDYGETNGYKIIFNAELPKCDEQDITEEILKQLNQKFASEK